MNALAWDIKEQVEKEITDCIECKRCLIVCPLPEAKGLDISKLNSEIINPQPSKEILDFAFLCFSCGACNASCPKYVRRDLHMVFLRSKGRLPKGFTNLLHWRGMRMNPLDRALYKLKRLKDARPAMKPFLDKTRFQETDTLFYFACYAYSPSKIPEKTLGIADHLNLDYDVVAGYTHCCGWPHFLAGDFDRAQPLFEDLSNTIMSTGAKRVVTGCGECYQALKFIKERYLGEFEVLSTTQWIHENIDRLNLEKTKGTATFHDGCQFSRIEDHLSETPREILQRLFNLVEMEENRKKTLCCGGMRAAHEAAGLTELRNKRLTDSRLTGADSMITECVTCFEKYKPLAVEGEVVDLTEAVYDRIKK